MTKKTQLEILKLQFDHIKGFVDTLIFSSDPSRPIELHLKQQFFFILHEPNLAHWVVLKKINHHDEDKWFLDNLNHLSYVAKLYYSNLFEQYCIKN